jgi:DNA-binding NarL/FixJ family response regulator
VTEPIRVVIADDHELVREGTRQLLAKYPDIDVVATAEDGHAVLEAIGSLMPDVALVDIAMPGLTGIDVTKQVKASYPSVAVLILTIHDEDGYVRALLEAGAAGYLLKDIGEAELVGSIRAVHAGDSVLHPRLTKALFAGLRSDPVGEPVQSPLSERENDVLHLAAQGQSNKQIAAHLDLSPRTVQTHLGHIFEKLGVASRTEAVISGLRKGWLDLEELT